MIFGNLEKALENEQSINEAVKQNFDQSYQNIMKKPTAWSKILTSLSHYGMNYSDQVYKNMVAFPADKSIQPKDDVALQQVIDFVFFTDQESKYIEKEDKSFEKISKYNYVRAEAYVMGKQVCAIEDTGFSNVDQVMDKLVTILPKNIHNARVQQISQSTFSSCICGPVQGC